MNTLDQIPVLFCFPLTLVVTLFIVGLYASNHNRAHAMLDNRRASQQDAGEPAQATGQRVVIPVTRGAGEPARTDSPEMFVWRVENGLHCWTRADHDTFGE